MGHNFKEFPKIKLPPGSRTFSGGIMLRKYGGEMWDDLKKWLELQPFRQLDVIDKMKEIEKEYGID